METLKSEPDSPAQTPRLEAEVARRTEFWRAAMGLVILALVVLFPQGVAGGLRQLVARWRQPAAGAGR